MNEEPILNENEPIPQDEQPTNAPHEKKQGIVSSIFDVVEMFAFSVLAVLIIFTFGVRLCRVDGESMENTLQNGENLLLYSFAYTPKQDDIIVFHLTRPEVRMEKTLVKRVIATGGQELKIDFKEAKIYVDGIEYADSHAILKNPNNIYSMHTLDMEQYRDDYANGVLTVTVPEGQLFVMGDNRNNSKDSRSGDVGFVDERCVLGKAILRLFPFTVFQSAD